MASRKQAKRQKGRVWLSYDLGLRGNYDALYEWLDEKGAAECGDSIATFQTDRTKDELRSEQVELLGESSKARIYLVVQDLVNHRVTGTFLLGKRKAAPWTGYFQSTVENALDQ